MGISKLPIEIFGIDLAEHQINMCKERFKNQLNVHISKWNALNLPRFWTKRFDFVICLGATAGNWDEKTRFGILKEMKRVIKKDGKILISAYSENAREAQLEWYMKNDLKIIQDKISSVSLEGGITSLRFSKDTLKNLAKKVELEIVIEKLSPIAYMAIFTCKTGFF